MSKLKVFTAFSGYDSQMIALKNRLKLDCDLVGWSEIDKYAIEAHNILFPEYSKRNFGDISKINWNKVPDFDLFTYSSPCQDFSTAGQQAGGAKGSGTRSSLLWECERAIKIKKPKYLLFENVPAVLNKNNVGVFNQWCKKLKSLGYTNFYKVINAIDCNVPQSRKRLFMVSILGNAKYTFPEPRKRLTKVLRDVIDDEVDEKYFLTKKLLLSRINDSLRSEARGGRAVFNPKTTSDVASTLTTNTSSQFCNFIISYSRDKKGNVLNYHPKPVANTLTCTSRESTTMQWLKWNGKIRKLTPAEYFRLMGLNESEVKKMIHSGISDCQLYKLAGNSIVVDVLEAIFGNLFGKRHNSTLSGVTSRARELLSIMRKNKVSKPKEVKLIW